MIQKGKSVTLATGSRGCGKNLLLELICQIANSDTVIFTDTTTIIGLHIQRKTEVGLALQQNKSEIKLGELLKGNLVFQAVVQWMREMAERQNIYQFLIAGGARSEEENRLWKSFGMPTRVIHVATTPEQDLLGVNLRQRQTGIIRPDENPEALLKARELYEKQIVPGLDVFGKAVLHTHRSKTVRMRLEESIEHMAIPSNISKRWLDRLAEKSNSVSIRVDILDGVTKKGKPARVESQVQEGNYPQAISGFAGIVQAGMQLSAR